MSQHALTWGETPTQDDKLWAAVAHLSCFTGFVVLGPLLVMLLFQDKSKYVKYHAFQAILGQVVLAVVGGMSAIFISVIAAFTCGIGMILYPLLMLLGIVPLWGAWIAWNGQWEGFPGVADFGKQ